MCKVHGPHQIYKTKLSTGGDQPTESNTLAKKALLQFNATNAYLKHASEWISSLNFHLLFEIFPQTYTNAVVSFAGLWCPGASLPKIPPESVFYSIAICFWITFTSSDLIQLRTYLFTVVVGEKKFDINFMIMNTTSVILTENLNFKKWLLM